MCVCVARSLAISCPPQNSFTNAQCAEAKGLLDKSQVKRMILYEMGEKVSEADLQKYMKEVDRGKPFIDFNEFLDVSSFPFASPPNLSFSHTNDLPLDSIEGEEAKQKYATARWRTQECREEWRRPLSESDGLKRYKERDF